MTIFENHQTTYTDKVSETLVGDLVGFHVCVELHVDDCIPLVNLPSRKSLPLSHLPFPEFTEKL